MQLHHQTWYEVEEYLKNKQLIIIPIGSTEQHGPNGLIGTDAITADAIAQKVGQDLNVLVAPCINIGMALHHMDFPGSMSIRPQTLIQVVVDALSGLARNGFRQFYFINGHGGNIATLTAALSELYWELETKWGIDNVRGTVYSWFLSPQIAELCKKIFNDQEGYHATPSEISLTQYLLPHTIKEGASLPAAASVHELNIYSSKDFRRRFPDGRMGSHSALASPEAGQQVFEVAVAACREHLGKWMNME